MTRRAVLALLLSLPMLAAARRAVEPKPHVRDEAHSQINFVGSSRLVDAQGYWDRWDAAILFDPDALDRSSVTITFASKIVNAPAGPSPDSLMANTRLLITGDLTIRGITKTITVPSSLVFFDRRANRGRVKGQFTILRKDYDVGFDPPMNPVANEVQVAFDISFMAPPGQGRGRGGGGS